METPEVFPTTDKVTSQCKPKAGCDIPDQNDTLDIKDVNENRNDGLILDNKDNTSQGNSKENGESSDRNESHEVLQVESILHGSVREPVNKDLNVIWKQLLLTPGVAERTAIIFGEEVLTFDEVERKSNLLACHLQQVIGKPRSNGHLGQRIVATFIPENECRLITILALIKMEVIYVPLDVMLPKERMQHIIKDSGASVLLYQGDNYLRFVKDLNDLIILIDIDIIFDAFVCAEEEDPEVKIVESNQNNSSVVSMLYTSGSTGKPKQVMLRHSNLINRLEWQWNTLPWQDDDIGCHKTSVLFVDSLTEVLGCLLAGRPIAVIPRHVLKDPSRFVDTLHMRKVTRVVVVPSLLQNMVIYGDAKKLGSIKTYICSGEALPASLATTFLEKCPKSVLINLYGSTETTGDVTYIKYTTPEEVKANTYDGYIAVGKPIDNNEIYILDQELHPVKEGELGEIYIAGANITEGNISRSEDCFLDNNINPSLKRMYKPGDYAVLYNGNIVYQGRQDSQVKVRGHRINLREIEQVLEDITSVDEVCVITCPCRSGSVVVAFYTTNTRQHPKRKVLLQTIKQQLPSYMLPVLVRLEAIPLQSQTGKVDRVTLKRLYAELCEVTKVDTDEELQSDAYRSVLWVMASELGVPESLLEPSMCFSDLGGNSLAAVTVVLRLNRLGFRVTIEDLVTAPSLGALADSVETRGKICDFINPSVTSDVIRRDMSDFKVVPMTDAHRKEVTNLLAHGFTERNPLDIIAGTTYEAFCKLVDSIWKEVMDDGLSFMVTRAAENGEELLVAADISLDIQTAIEPCFLYQHVAAINEEVENPVKERLLKTGQRWLDNMLLAIDPALPDEVGFAVLHLMEEHLLRLAAKHGYHGIVTVNSHPVTMAVAENFFGYKVEKTIHVRTFELNGTFPFKMAADDYVIKAMTRPLTSI